MGQKTQVSIDELKKQSYLFDAKEVKLTGRCAIKEYGRTKEHMFEIYHPNCHDSWKKWVRLQDLWVVHSASETVYIPKDLVDAVRRVVAEKN